MTRDSAKDKILVKTSWVSTIGNGILSIFKILVGIFAGSLAVLSDGLDSATDAIISIVMIITAYIMKRPPNRQYVYGYEKAEGIATKVLALVIFYAGMQMFATSIESIFSSSTKAMPHRMAIYVTLLSIVGKIALSYYQYRQGKKINSSMLIANAKNMRNDVVVSIGVLLGLFATFILKLPILDSVMSLIISLFIIKSSISIFMDSNAELMDGVKDTTVYDKIFEAVAKVPEAKNPHRVRSRQIGNLYAISLDIEVDGNKTVTEAHQIAEEVEGCIKDSIEDIYDILVHIEPEGIVHPPERFGVDKKSIR